MFASYLFTYYLVTHSLTHPLTHPLTHSLAAWSRVFPEKLPSSQLVKKFHAFYGTWKFVTAFTSARYLSLPWTRSIHSMPPHPTSWRSIFCFKLTYCIYSVVTIHGKRNTSSHLEWFLYFYVSTSRNVFAVSSCLFSVVPWFGAFPVCCSGILWINLRWFLLPLCSLLFLHYTRPI